MFLYIFDVDANRAKVFDAFFDASERENVLANILKALDLGEFEFIYFMRGK
jgi:hypothetical protein